MKRSPIAFIVGLLAVMTEPLEGAQLSTTAEETIAAVLIGEAGGEGRTAMQGVMETINNRARGLKREWLAEALKPGQYSVLNGTTARQLIDTAKTHRRWQLALTIIRYFVDKQVVRGAKYFHSPMPKPPYWAKGKPVVAKIGKLTFYKF